LLVIVDGNKSHSDSMAFEKFAEELRSTMKKMDKELTFFVIGPTNIVEIVKDYCVKNEDFREKRIKAYNFNRAQIMDYGLNRFNTYLYLNSQDSKATTIDEGFELV